MFATFFGLFSLAGANPLKFPGTSKSAEATTTVSYLWTGNGTTTSPTLDAYSQPSAFAHNEATLFIQMGASSTASSMNINIEYSHDNIEWYEDGGTYSVASTSKPFDISQVNQLRMTFASSTPNGLAAGASDATTTRAVKIATPTRYVRAVFTLVTGAAGANVWSEWVPIKEVSE